MRTTELPAAFVSPYSEAQLQFAVAAWPMRAAEELRSALIFRALARAARDSGMPEPWPTRFAAATCDEVRHARLCAIVGARLGAPAPTYRSHPARTRIESLPEPVVRLTSLLLVEVAVGETISTCLFRAGRRASKEPLTRAALGIIVGDEIHHQQLGWAALASLWPTLTDPVRTAMQREAARGLGACEQQTACPAMGWLEKGRPFAPAYAALGVLHPEARIEAFYAAVETLVLPRLTYLGIDGALAWKNRYRDS